MGIMIVILMVWISAMFVRGQEFRSGVGSPRTQEATRKLVEVAPPHTEDDVDNLVRSLVKRDRLYIAAVAVVFVLVLIVAAVVIGDLPRHWIVLNEQTTVGLFAVAIFQFFLSVVRTSWSLQRVLNFAEGSARTARTRWVGPWDYSTKVDRLFPLALLGFALAITVIVIAGAASGRLESGGLTPALAGFTISAVVWAAVSLIARKISLRSATADSQFGLFTVDLLRIEAVRSLYAFSSSVTGLIILFLMMPTSINGMPAGFEALTLTVTALAVILVLINTARLTGGPTNNEPTHTLLRHLWPQNAEVGT